MQGFFVFEIRHQNPILSDRRNSKVEIRYLEIALAKKCNVVSKSLTLVPNFSHF